MGRLIKYDCFWYIFGIGDPFATKLLNVVHHNNSEYPMKSTGLLHQGQGHGES